MRRRLDLGVRSVELITRSYAEGALARAEATAVIRRLRGDELRWLRTALASLGTDVSRRDDEAVRAEAVRWLRAGGLAVLPVAAVVVPPARAELAAPAALLHDGVRPREEVSSLEAEIEGEVDAFALESALEGEIELGEMESSLEGEPDFGEMESSLEGETDFGEMESSLEGETEEEETESSLEGEVEDESLDAALEGEEDELDAA